MTPARPDSGVVNQAPHVAAWVENPWLDYRMIDLEREWEGGRLGEDWAALRARCRGAMLGLAVGNLLGLRVEGCWYHQIDEWYPDGIREIDPRERLRPMDDDVAQAVELGDALVAGEDLVAEFSARMVVWLENNGRGCGRTTRSAIREMQRGVRAPEAARSVYEMWGWAPNGGLMRCAPVGIARRNSPGVLVGDSAATCAVTHYAPACQWSCIIVNAVIAGALRPFHGDGFGQCLSLRRVHRDSAPYLDLGRLFVAAALDGAPDFGDIARADGIPTEVFDALATGGSIPEDASWLRRDQCLIGHTLLALQVGLWAAATPLAFEDALVSLVGTGGDTDTNGAIAGAVLGARQGWDAIPNRWLTTVPERERIETLADDLAVLGYGDEPAPLSSTPWPRWDDLPTAREAEEPDGAAGA